MDLSPWALSPTTALLPRDLLLQELTPSCPTSSTPPLILHLSFLLEYKHGEVSPIFLKRPPFHGTTLYISLCFSQAFKNVCIVSTIFSLILFTSAQHILCYFLIHWNCALWDYQHLPRCPIQWWFSNRIWHAFSLVIGTPSFLKHGFPDSIFSHSFPTSLAVPHQSLISGPFSVLYS